MNTGIQETTDKIRMWGIMRGLDQGDPARQINKLGEEYGELCRGVNKGNQEEIVDALGDMYVVMVQVAMQHGVSIEYCIQTAYNEIKDRQGKMVNGVFVKEADLK